MAGHLLSAPGSGFHIGKGTDVQPAHFWSQGPLVNGVRSWQLNIKHDLTHRFHGRTLVSAPVSWFHICDSADVEPSHFWSQGPLVNGFRSWQLIINHDLKQSLSWPGTWYPPQGLGSTSVRAPM